MRADEDAGVRDFAQYGVERRARVAGIDRIDPDQRPVELQQLIAQLVRLRQVVDRRARVDASCRKGGEDGGEAVVLARRKATDLAVAWIDDGDLQWTCVKTPSLVAT